jgi:hypothetical protein
MHPILEPIFAGVLVSLWSSFWSKYALPALCAKCHHEDDDIGEANSAISSDVEIHVHAG